MESNDKYLNHMANIWIENCARNLPQKHKIHHSNGELAPIIFIHFTHVKTSQKQLKTHQERIVIFGIFARNSKRTDGPNSKNRGCT